MTEDTTTLPHHLLLHTVFGVLLGAVQFLELGLNLPIHLALVDTVALMVFGLGHAGILGLTVALFLSPFVLISKTEPWKVLSRFLLLGGSVYLAALLMPFAWNKWTQNQQVLAGMVVAVWLLLVLLLHTNGRFWIRRLVQQGNLRKLYAFLSSVSILVSGIGIGAFQNRGYGGSNAISSDPDVVVISLDGIGVNALSRYSESSFALTPNLDALANQCMDFSEAISVSTEVFPGHVAMFTGRYPGQINIVNDDGLLKFASKTVAERFVKEGYATTLFANAPALNMAQGFAQGIQLIDVDQPLDVFGYAIRGGGGYRFGGWIQQVSDMSADPTTPLNSLSDFMVSYTQKPVFAWVQSKIPDNLDSKAYRAQVERVDKTIGTVLRTLDQREVERERLLILTSTFGNHFEYGKSDRRGISESVVRVPLIVCPLESNGTHSQSIEGQVRTVDIPNTIYAQVGFAHNKEISSVDISDQQKQHVVYQTILMGSDPESDGFQLGYRFQAASSDYIYKYKWYTHRTMHGVYNLSKDPTELDNILGSANSMATELSTALIEAARLIPNLEVEDRNLQSEMWQAIP